MLSESQHHELQFGENLVDGNGKEKKYALSEDLLLENTLKAELDRIYQGRKNRKAKGHNRNAGYRRDKGGFWDSDYGIYIYIQKKQRGKSMTEEMKRTLSEQKPSNNVPEDLWTRYDVLKEMVTVRKDQWLKLMEFLEQETSWLTAPASTRFHLCREHGLLEHSVNVAETLLRMKVLLAPEISDESCVVTALLHDLGKAGMPGNPQYIPNEPSEKQRAAGYPASKPYSFNSDLVYMSVPARSLYLAGSRFPFTETEAQAILYHDGQYVEDNHCVATHEEKLTLLLQYADNWCGFVKETE